MIRKNFVIPIYKYKVFLIQLTFDDYANGITTKKLGLSRLLIWKRDLAEIDDCIKDKCYDGAITLFNKSKHQFIVLFYPFKSIDVQLEVYGHEKRHIEDDLLNCVGSDDLEASAYLAGYLTVVMAKFFKTTRDSL